MQAYVLGPPRLALIRTSSNAHFIGISGVEQTCHDRAIMWAMDSWALSWAVAVYLALLVGFLWRLYQGLRTGEIFGWYRTYFSRQHNPGAFWIAATGYAICIAMLLAFPLMYFGIFPGL